MRTVIVSAHYPPNFVSGGTLVPQRIARGLAARGHDVFVYAGSLDRTKAPLSTWDERDESGLPVRWIATYPWIDWAAERTYDNPPVADDFSGWASAIRPDIVHLHSLQSLGAGLVERAADLGARVVVTAHDFWWQCARQFLVDREGRPCSLVVKAGTCQCEAGQGHLTRRTLRLVKALRAAHVVLAPSASAARILVANGVDPDRVRVDENGMPSEPAPPAPVRPDRTGPVRLLYAGGPDAMKGWPILAEAALALRENPGWTLTAYGVEASPQAAQLPEQVTSRPAFGPDELSDVLAAHDVLVLPSVARETYSLITREALMAGMAVVTSDVPGPAEVIDHGRNGLVVPAGDVETLTASLASLAADPAAVDRLRTSPPPRIRSMDEQIDGLESLYATLLAAPEPIRGDALPEDPYPGSPPVPLPTPLARPLAAPGFDRFGRSGTHPGPAGGDPGLARVLFIVGIQGAPLRYRAQLPAAGLRSLGLDVEVRWYRDPDLPHLATLADAVVCYRVPATVQLLGLLDAVRADPRAVPVVFDIDDLIFDPGMRGRIKGLAALSSQELELWWHGVARYRTTMEACDLYVGSTNALCEHAARLTGMPTRRFANGVGELMGRLSDTALRRPRTPGPLRIGYFSGTTTHDADWAAIEPAVIEAMLGHDEVELWLGGHLTPTPALDALADRVRRLPMRPWYDLPDLLRDVDVNLAPLRLAEEPADNLFNEAKSAIKWSEAALVATPTIASPTEPFRELVVDGTSGLLANTTPEWAQALEHLLGERPERARIGGTARREALLRLSPDLQARAYLSILTEARRRRVLDGRREVTSGWEPVADDEPWDGGVVEPLELPVVVDEPSPAQSSRARRLTARAAEVYRTEGARSVLRRGVAVARRRATGGRVSSP